MKRIPTVIQFATAECGHACARMLLSAHGRDVSVGSLRRELPVGRDGTNLRQVAALLEHHGLNVRVRRADFSGGEPPRTPAILFWNNSHFVVLVSLTRRGAVIIDPSVGRLRMDLQELREKYSGVCVEVVGDTRAPGPRERRRSTTSSSAHGYRSPIILGAAALAGLGVGITPSAVASLWFSEPRNVVGGLALLIGTTMLFLTAALTAAAQGAAAHRAASKALFTHLLHLPMAYFDARVPAELAGRLVKNDTARDILLADRVGAATGAGALIGASTAMTVVFAPGLLVFGIGGVILAGSIAIGIHLARMPASAEAAHQRENTAAAARAIQSIVAVKSQGLEDREGEQWAASYDRLLDERRRVRTISGIVTTLRMSLLAAVPLSTLLLLPGGDVSVAGGAAALVFAFAAADLTDRVIRLHALQHDVDDITDILDEDATPSRVSIERDVAPGLHVDGVAYRYPGAPVDTLEHVDVTVPSGHSVAIVGASGSGKSTLAQLLVGLRSPSRGRVVVGSVDPDVTVGYVPQTPIILDGSIRSNITLDREDVTAADLDDAIDAVGLRPLLEATPMGLETPLSHTAATLSGGQRQRIALARALVRRPAILVLDEATSALDPDSERVVLDACARRVATRVLITHDAAVAALADDVMVLENGRILLAFGANPTVSPADARKPVSS